MAPINSLHHKIWRIAWPAILSNISVPLLGLVDTALLGHLDNIQYLGAAAIGASVLSFVYWGFGFLRMGTTGLVARAAGAGDTARELTVVLQSLVLALLLAAPVILLHPLWASFGLWLMSPEAHIAPLASSYISIRVFSAPAVLVTYAVVGWCIGRQDTRWPMLIVVFTNLLNIALDVLFIRVFDWRSDGAALATLLAEYAGCLLALAVLYRRCNWEPLAQIRSQLRRYSAYRELLESNRYLFVRTMCLLFGFAFFTAMSTRMGSDVLAANTIMLQLLMLAAYGLDGFAFAAEGLAGNAAGAGNLDHFHRVVAACTRWCLGTAALFSGSFLLVGAWLYPIFTTHENVLVLLSTYQWWLIAMPLVAVWSYLMDGVFIGAARTRYMMRSMLVSLFLVYLPAWYLLQGFGNHGLWLAFLLFNGARGLTLALDYRHLNRIGGWLDSPG